MNHKLDQLTIDRIHELIESRKFTDGQIAQRFGLHQSAVSYRRRKLGYPPVSEEPKEVVCIKPRNTRCPITKYFDETCKAWVSVYEAMFAGGYLPSKSAWGFTGLYEAGNRKPTGIGTNSRRNA